MTIRDPAKRALRGATAAASRLLRLPPYHPVVARVNGWTADAGDATRTVHGVAFDLDLREHIARYIYWTGEYEPAFTREFLASLREGMTVVDVGANLGWFSLLAARRVGRAGRVLAVEPVAANADRLEAGARRNSLTNVEVARLAASDAPGVLELHPPVDDNRGTYSVAAVDADAARTLRVPAARLDDVLRERRVGRVDVLKIDVQGAESRVLRGARETLREGAPLVFCEIHPRHLASLGEKPADVLGLLADAGYEAGTIREGRFLPLAVEVGEAERMVVFRAR